MKKKDGKFTEERRDRDMFIFFNCKDGTLGKRSLDAIKKNHKVNWIFHPENADVDIAIIPFGLEVGKDDVRTIPDHLHFGPSGLLELYDVFFFSYQPGLELEGKISPIIRTGTLSLLHQDGTFYIDGFSFPGNSGSPVFLKPSSADFEFGTIKFGNDKLGGKFIGIIGSYITYRETAISTQTGRARVIFEENTGLSKVWSVKFISEIVQSENFIQQVNRLRKK